MALPTSIWSVDEASLTRFTKSLQRPADDPTGSISAGRGRLGSTSCTEVSELAANPGRFVPLRTNQLPHTTCLHQSAAGGFSVHLWPDRRWIGILVGEFLRRAAACLPSPGPVPVLPTSSRCLSRRAAPRRMTPGSRPRRSLPSRSWLPSRRWRRCSRPPAITECSGGSARGRGMEIRLPARLCGGDSTSTWRRPGSTPRRR